QTFSGFSPPSTNWRISDFSILDPPTIKQINFVRSDRQLTKRRIWNVKNSRLSRLMREFPTNEPLPKQCAHWMRAIAGIHLFPDANHRTGINTLQILVAENPCEVELTISGEIEWYVLQSKLIRHLQADVRFDTLWKRDEHYTLWHRYFRSELCGEDHAHAKQADIEHLRTVLSHARKQKEGFRNGS
ncbi:MAG: prophage maintenance system killer protein, partial [Natronomonas sp.]